MANIFQLKSQLKKLWKRLFTTNIRSEFLKLGETKTLRFKEFHICDNYLLISFIDIILIYSYHLLISYSSIDIILIYSYHLLISYSSIDIIYWYHTHILISYSSIDVIFNQKHSATEAHSLNTHDKANLCFLKEKIYESGNMFHRFKCFFRHDTFLINYLFLRYTHTKITYWFTHA